MDVEVKLAASAFPARSFTRGSVAPPFTTTVYAVELRRTEEGESVAVREPADHVTLEGTTELSGARSSIVDVLIVAASIGSLNSTETVPFVEIPDAPFDGLTELTTGGVVSGPIEVTKITSTQ